MLEKLQIRLFREQDTAAVIRLWSACGLLVPQNDPRQDINLKMAFQPELFFTGGFGQKIVATVMAGYEGHRGWLNYLAVLPRLQGRGIGRNIVQYALEQLKVLGCPKVNLQVRTKNSQALAFYRKIGFSGDDVVSLGFRFRSGKE